MERIQPMNELQIQEKVEDLAGKSAKILDCEQNTMSQMEEVLLVNGIRISLAGEEGAKIKEALIHGEVPPCELVNNMLIRAGIETNPVELETTVNVKSSIKTVEHSTLVDRNGVLVDEKMKEKEDEDEFRKVNVEIWSTEDVPLGSAENPQITTTTTSKTKDKKAKDKEVETIPSVESKSNKKSLFSPSGIIKSNKSDSKNKAKKSQTEAVNKSASPPDSNTPSTPNVPKNKFLSLFKGKSKDKNNSSKQQQQQQAEGNPKDKNVTSSSSDKQSTVDQSNKSKKNAKNNKDSNKDVMNKSSSINTQPKIETKKQNVNVNYLDPSRSLVHVEIDGIPVRVTYETFV